MASKKPRLSLTKTQLQAGVGAELLTLCQTVTADGKLSVAEITELRQWLSANRSSDLPAIEFLVSTLDRILADGKVTTDEYKELYGAIEAVLPPEARRSAVSARKTVEADQKASESERKKIEAEQKTLARQERNAEERQERERQRPLTSINFMVAGVHYEGRPEIIREHIEDYDAAYLVRDTQNKFSRNAVEVRLPNGLQIGFVPEEYASEIAPLLDRGCPHTAHFTKVLWGGRVPIPVVQAYIHREDAGVEGLVFPGDVPAKRQPGQAYIRRKMLRPLDRFLRPAPLQNVNRHLNRYRLGRRNPAAWARFYSR